MNTIILRNAGLPMESFAILCSTVKRRMQERLCKYAEGGYLVTVSVQTSMRADAYVLTPDDIGTTVTTGGISGAFAGVGEFLLRSRFDGCGEYTPFCDEFALCPTTPIHGMYLASHFYNYYHTAPIMHIQHLIEDLALRGCNALNMWYDMHQYKFVDEPASLEMIARLKQLYAYVRKVGMQTILGGLANEAFDGTPEEIRADWHTNGLYKAEPCGHYHVEICPSAPGGLAEIIRQRRQVIEAFRSIKFDYISFWPYDQGGCTCPACAPWGANGFLKIAPAFRTLVDELMPGTKILCGVWYFDRFIDGEWDAFAKRMDSGEFDYFTYLNGYYFSDIKIPACIRQGHMPGGKKMIAFPEISMWGCVPWGGFGTNSTPNRLERDFRNECALFGDDICGAGPYSEGIYEDLNKVLMLNFYSGRSADAVEIVREYARFELCADDKLADKFYCLTAMLEETLPRHRRTVDGRIWDYIDAELQDGDHYRFLIENPKQVYAARVLAIEIDKELPPSIRALWRWRIVLLRALIDAELCDCDGLISDRCDTYLQELCDLYYIQPGKSYYVITPPTNAALYSKEGHI